MTLLIFGLATFAATHLFSRLRGLRAAAIERLGEMGYKGAYSLVSLAGLVLIIWGYAAARAGENPLVYAPLENNRALAHALMPFAFILAAGSNMRSNLKRYVGHPLSMAVILWAAVHLAANGDQASVLLFGALGLYALVALGLSLAAGPTPPPPPQPRTRDLALILAGLVGYAVVLAAHGWLFGVAVIG